MKLWIILAVIFLFLGLIFLKIYFKIKKGKKELEELSKTFLVPEGPLKAIVEDIKTEARVSNSSEESNIHKDTESSR